MQAPGKMWGVFFLTLFSDPGQHSQLQSPWQHPPALPRLSLGPGLDDKFRLVSLTAREIRIRLLRFCLTFHGHCLNILQKPILLADAPFTIYSDSYCQKFSSSVLATSVMRTSLPPQVWFTRSDILFLTRQLSLARVTEGREWPGKPR